MRYAGVTPHGMAVYEYGDGGKASLHSCLHTIGVERVPVSNHPEILFVPVTGERDEALIDKYEEFVYRNSPPDFSDHFERSAPPSVRRKKFSGDVQQVTPTEDIKTA